MPSSMDMAEMDRIKHDYALIQQDLMGVKQKYSELERVVYQVAASIDKAYTQSKKHENEFLKFKLEQSEKTEKLFYILSYFLTNQGMSESQQSKLSSASERFSQNNANIKHRTSIADSDLYHNNDETGYANNNNSSNLTIKKEECNNNNNNNGILEGGNNNNNNLDFPLQSQTTATQPQSQSHPRQQSMQQSRQQYQNQQRTLNQSIHQAENESLSNFSRNSYNASNNLPAIHGGQIDVIPESLMPFISKTEDQFQLSQKKIQSLADTFKTTKLPSMQRPEALFDVLQQIMNGKTMTVAEEAVNQLSLGNQAKRMLSSSMFGGNNLNSGRQNISLFENMQMKRICGSSQQDISGFLSDNSVNTNNNKMNGLGMQLGLIDGLDQSAEFKAMSLYQQQQSQKNIQGTGLFTPTYFNGGEASPRLAFNLYPSPTPNSGGHGPFQNSNNMQQGISTLLNSPSPNMSPRLLRDMEEFISQNTQRGGYSLGSGQNSIFEQQLSNSSSNKNLINKSQNNTSASTFDTLGIVNNMQNNKRISENLLRSLQTDLQADREIHPI